MNSQQIDTNPLILGRLIFDRLLRRIDHQGGCWPLLRGVYRFCTNRSEEVLRSISSTHALACFEGRFADTRCFSVSPIFLSVPNDTATLRWPRAGAPDRSKA
jgi:hypothetical protein